MLCKCHCIVLYTVHFTAFCLGLPFLSGHGVYPFDAHCCHIGTNIVHPVPDRGEPYVICSFDSRALCHSGLSVRVPRYQKLQIAA